jgi:hypothetical protein
MLGLPKLYPFPLLLVYHEPITLYLGIQTFAIYMQLALALVPLWNTSPHLTPLVHQYTIYALALQPIHDLDDRLVRLLWCLQLPGNKLSPTWFMPCSLLFPTIAHVLSMLLLLPLLLLLYTGATAIARLALVAKNAIHAYAIHHATLPIEIMA